jgi:hypothetical protein
MPLVLLSGQHKRHIRKSNSRSVPERSGATDAPNIVLLCRKACLEVNDEQDALHEPFDSHSTAAARSRSQLALNGFDNTGTTSVSGTHNAHQRT